MQRDGVIYEQIRFGRDEYLAGILGYPAHGNPTRAVLVCSPHPNFGGDMENNVVQALAEGLSANAVTLRFDYRGIGQSRIDLSPGLSAFDYWENLEQTLAYADPLADTSAAVDQLSVSSGELPMVAVGYSFGAIMGTSLAMRDRRIVAAVGISTPLRRASFEHLTGYPKPCLLISGRGDFVYDAEVARKLIDAAGHNLTLETPAGDHFFVGAEADLVDRVARFVHASASPDQMVALDGSN